MGILVWLAETFIGIWIRGLFKAKPSKTIAQVQAENEAKPDTDWHDTVGRL